MVVLHSFACRSAGFDAPRRLLNARASLQDRLSGPFDACSSGLMVCFSRGIPDALAKRGHVVCIGLQTNCRLRGPGAAIARPMVATSQTSIVRAFGGEVRSRGIVKRLARLGGNITAARSILPAFSRAFVVTY